MFSYRFPYLLRVWFIFRPFFLGGDPGGGLQFGVASNQSTGPLLNITDELRGGDGSPFQMFQKRGRNPLSFEISKFKFVIPFHTLFHAKIQILLLTTLCWISAAKYFYPSLTYPCPIMRVVVFIYIGRLTFRLPPSNQNQRPSHLDTRHATHFEKSRFLCWVTPTVGRYLVAKPSTAVCTLPKK